MTDSSTLADEYLEYGSLSDDWIQTAEAKAVRRSLKIHFQGVESFSVSADASYRDAGETGVGLL